MKKYLAIICEKTDSLPFVLVESFLNKSKKKVQISDNLFLFSTDKDNLRIDEVCFSLGQEGKSSVVVIEINKGLEMSMNINNPKWNKMLDDFFEDE